VTPFLTANGAVLCALDPMGLATPRTAIGASGRPGTTIGTHGGKAPRQDRE
jgi:hypothetical protein